MVPVELIVTDVDGTLTAGDVTFADVAGGTVELKTFSIRDGLLMKALPRLGVPIVFLTGRRSAVTDRRAQELDVVGVLQGVDDKCAALRAYLEQRGVDPLNVAYVGDDLNDYSAMEICGFRACPSDAVPEIRRIATYVSPMAGGAGAFRDIGEHLLRLLGRYNDLLALYGVALTDPGNANVSVSEIIR